MIEIDDNERLLLVVHKHWFILVGDIFLFLVSLAIPVFMLFGLSFVPLAQFFTLTGSLVSLEGFFLFAWLLIVWMIGWNMWTDYYLDVFLVTNKRVFDIKQHGLFKRVSTSFRIDRIQNCTVIQNGILQTLLDFGTVHIETAGEGDDMIATYIAHPYDIKKYINEMQDAALDKSQAVHVAEQEIPTPIKPPAE